MRPFLVLILLLAGCSGGSPTGLPPAAAPERAEIRVPLSLYVLTDVGDPVSGLSSTRTIEEVEAISQNVGTIWAAAGIVFDPVVVEEVEVPADVLLAIANSLDPGPFFDLIASGFDIPDPGLVNGFYVRQAGGVNGFTPPGSSVFFVVDEPTVNDERVSSHELGHIFGLRHNLDDQERLLFSGTNGVDLVAEEQTVARYGAQGFLDAAG